MADANHTPRFKRTHCSQCGGEFGPGDEGYSHCEDHTKPQCLPIPTDRNQGWPGIYAVLYTDEINGEQTCRDDLWIATTAAIKVAIERAQQDAYAEGRKDEAEENDAASQLIDAWALAHGKPVPWAKSVEIIAIIKKLTEEERARLLALWDDAA